MLQALLVHHQHHEVNALDANLKSPASTANGYERGRAPPTARPTARHAAAVFAAKNESTLHQVGHHHDALSAIEYFLRNPLIRGRHDFVQNRRRVIQALRRVFAGRARPGENSAPHYGKL